LYFRRKKGIVLNSLDYWKIKLEILKIYNEMFNPQNSYEDIMGLYIKYLKLDVKLEKSLPSFIYFPNGFKYGNCYTYALGLKCPKHFYELCESLENIMCFDVGFLTKKKEEIRNTCERKFLENLYADCEELKIRVYDCAKLPMHGGYRIFVYIDRLMEYGRSNDFHFVRENKNGILSHKNGYNGSIEKLKSLKEVPKDYKLIRTLEIVR